MSKKKPAAPVQPEAERARDDDGKFVADDPSTPDVNEAYVQPETDDAVEATEGQAPAAAEPEAAPVETAEAVEPEAPAGVVETEQQIPAEEAVFVAQSHIKVNGTRYAPGTDVSGLTADDAARMLASGSIKPKE